MKIVVKENLDDRLSIYEAWYESGDWRSFVGQRFGDVWKEIPFPYWCQSDSVRIQCKDTAINDLRTYVSVDSVHFDHFEFDLNILSVRKLGKSIFVILDATSWTKDEFCQYCNDNYLRQGSKPVPLPSVKNALNDRINKWERDVDTANPRPKMPLNIEALMDYSSWILKRARSGKPLQDIVDELYSLDGSKRMAGREFTPSEAAERLDKFASIDSFRKWVKQINSIQDYNYRAYLDAIPDLDDNIEGTVPEYIDYPEDVRPV